MEKRWGVVGERCGISSRITNSNRIRDKREKERERARIRRLMYMRKWIFNNYVGQRARADVKSEFVGYPDRRINPRARLEEFLELSIDLFRMWRRADQMGRLCRRIYLKTRSGGPSNSELRYRNFLPGFGSTQRDGESVRWRNDLVVKTAVWILRLDTLREGRGTGRRNSPGNSTSHRCASGNVLRPPVTNTPWRIYKHSRMNLFCRRNYC